MKQITIKTPQFEVKEHLTIITEAELYGEENNDYGYEDLKDCSVQEDKIYYHEPLLYLNIKGKKHLIDYQGLKNLLNKKQDDLLTCECGYSCCGGYDNQKATFTPLNLTLHVEIDEKPHKLKFKRFALQQHLQRIENEVKEKNTYFSTTQHYYGFDKIYRHLRGNLIQDFLSKI